MSSQTDLFDCLFESLPRITPRLDKATGALRAHTFDAFKYPFNAYYIGFTPTERRREHQLQNWLEIAGILPKAERRCEVCKIEGPCSYHAENYYDVWSMNAICGSCHKTLHMRHRHPYAWQDLVAQYARTGEEWFALTPLSRDADFAGYLRRRFGEAYAVVEHTSLAVIPEAVRQCPDNLLSISFPSEPNQVGPVGAAVNGGEAMKAREREITRQLSFFKGPIKPTFGLKRVAN